MVARTGQTVIASTVFVDIVGYTKVPISDQIAWKAWLNKIIGAAIAHVAEADRLILDTGDGAALCFFGDPEDALFVATAINDPTKKEVEAAFSLRTGIHLGPVKVTVDLNGRPNILGDGINFAQRVMDFAAEDEILVSRAYYEVVARLQEGNERLFRYLGIKKDKHVREHQIYSVSPQAASAPEAPRESTVRAGRQLVAGLTPDLMRREEQRLADRIGPLAKVIVGRAAESARNVEEFYQTIAAVIPDAADRSAFLAGADSALAGGGGDPAGQARTSRLDGNENARLSASEIATVERALSRYIGPLAKILVDRETAGAADLPDLYQRLSVHIKNESDKRAFLALARARQTEAR